MSTKIYDAYVLPAGTDAVVATARVADALEPVRRDLALTAVATTASMLWTAEQNGKDRPGQLASALVLGLGHVTTDMVEKAAIGSITKSSTFMLSVAVVQAVNEVTEHHHVFSDVDLHFAVCWLADPEPDPDGNHRTYARIYTTQDAYRKAFLATTGATDFHYQNSTDQPEDVTDDAWDHRAKVWSRILDHGVAPAERGPSWELITNKHLTVDALPALNPNRWLAPEPVAARMVDFLTERKDRLHRPVPTVDEVTAWLQARPDQAQPDPAGEGTT